jgi:hypothetical protein
MVQERLAIGFETCRHRVAALARANSDLRLRTALADLPPSVRDLLRRALIGDQADRCVIASALLRFRDEAGDEMADIIGMLTINPDERRKVVRMLAEIDAAG